GLAWSSDGSEVWYTAMDSRVDRNAPLRASTLSGKTRVVARVPGQLRLLDIARDGRVLLALWDLRMGIRSSGLEATAERDLSWLDNGFLGDIAPDGKTIVFVDRNFLFLRRTDGSPPVRLGEGYAFDLARLSPDGKWILTVPASGARKIVLVPTGAGEVRRFDSAPECLTAEWFPDGKRILVGQVAPGERANLFVLEPESGKASALPVPADVRLSSETTTMLSRDVRRIAMLDAEGDFRILSAATGQEIRKVPGDAVAG